MAHVTKLALLTALCATIAAPTWAADIPISGGYVLEQDEDELPDPRIRTRVVVEEGYRAPPVQRRIVERHIIERYVEEPVEHDVVRRRTAEPVLVPPMPIGPVTRYEARVRVRPEVRTPVVQPFEDGRYARPVLDYRPVRSALPERRFVQAPEECRTVLTRRVDQFGYEDVVRTRVCD